MTSPKISFRYTVRNTDPGTIRKITESSGFFYPEEIDVAVELAETTLEKGAKAGYLFVFADIDDRSAGYACFGEIPCTQDCYDLYWIAVHDDFRGQGIGKQLMHETEDAVRKLKGRKIYIETASRDQYIPTQQFYLKNGYIIEARLTDYYSPGDDKLIFSKVL